jgi:hypothetical protein
MEQQGGAEDFDFWLTLENHILGERYKKEERVNIFWLCSVLIFHGSKALFLRLSF